MDNAECEPPVPADDAAEQPVSPARRVRTRWLVLSIMAVAGLIRFIGVWWALPYMPHPDEPVNMRVLQEMVTEQTANPGWFVYPSLFYDIQAVAHGGYVAAGIATGVFDSAADVGPVRIISPMGTAKTPHAPAVLLARLVSVLASVLTVGLVALLVHRSGGGRGATLGAAGLAAIAPLLVGYSWFVTPDTLSGLTATAAVVGALRVLRRGDLVDYLIAGALVGLAAGSKYNAVVVAVALIAAHLLRHRLHHLWRLVVAGACSAAVFVITTPFALLDFGQFRKDVESLLDHYSYGHSGFEGDAWRANALWLLGCFGLLAVALVGLRWVRNHRAVLVLGTFAVAYYVVVSLPVVRFERNLLPVVPTIIALLALGAEGWWRWATSDPGRSWARGALVVALAVGLLWPIVGTARRVEATLRDPTAAARHWIETNVPAGSTVAIESYAPFVDPSIWKVVPTWFVLTSRDQVMKADPDVVVVTRAGSGRFLGGVDRDAEGFLLELDTIACRRGLFPADGVWVFVLRCG